MKYLLTSLLLITLAAGLVGCDKPEDSGDQPADNDRSGLPPSVAPQSSPQRDGDIIELPGLPDPNTGEAPVVPAPVEETPDLPPPRPIDAESDPASPDEAAATPPEEPTAEVQPETAETDEQTQTADEPAPRSEPNEVARQPEPENQPELQPTPQPESQPQPQPSISSRAMAILEDLEAAGETYRSIKANVTYIVNNKLTGDVETRTGWVAYQQAGKDQPARFRVSFDTLAMGEGRPTKQKVDYIFDGQWLKVAKHNIKSLTHYQVAAEGETVEPLRIGKGPFPVPFGQKVEDVTRYLDVEVKDRDKDAPKGSDYLLLTPHKENRSLVNFNRLELWIDRQRHLPVKVRTVDESHNVVTVNFSDIETKAEMKPEWFTFEKPADWSLQIERMGG
jgi:outer membrane lipoprotein-sorting protein